MSMVNVGRYTVRPMDPSWVGQGVSHQPVLLIATSNTTWALNTGSFLVSGNWDPLFLGKSRLVKYDSIWPD